MDEKSKKLLAEYKNKLAAEQWASRGPAHFGLERIDRTGWTREDHYKDLGLIEGNNWDPSHPRWSETPLPLALFIETLFKVKQMAKKKREHESVVGLTVETEAKKALSALPFYSLWEPLGKNTMPDLRIDDTFVELKAKKEKTAVFSAERPPTLYAVGSVARMIEKSPLIFENAHVLQVMYGPWRGGLEPKSFTLAPLYASLVKAEGKLLLIEPARRKIVGRRSLSDEGFNSVDEFYEAFIDVLEDKRAQNKKISLFEDMEHLEDLIVQRLESRAKVISPEKD